MPSQRYKIININVKILEDIKQEDMSEVEAAFNDGYELLAITPVMGYKGYTKSHRYFMRKKIENQYVNTGPR